MKTFVALLVVLLWASADARNCYGCHEMGDYTCDQATSPTLYGAIQVFLEHDANGYAPCFQPPVDSLEHVQCSSGLTQCGVIRLAADYEYILDDVVETASIHDVVMRSCMPVYDKFDLADGCHDVNVLGDAFNAMIPMGNHIRHFTGTPLAGELSVSNVRGYLCLCSSSWCNQGTAPPLE